jgi:hypothetical protein
MIIFSDTFAGCGCAGCAIPAQLLLEPELELEVEEGAVGWVMPIAEAKELRLRSSAVCGMGSVAMNCGMEQQYRSGWMDGGV